jgi:DNA polymerase-1
VGRSEPVTTSTDPGELISVLNKADGITGHNGLNFDIMALARWHGADYEALSLKMFDTLIVERHLNPVAAKGMQRSGYYGLDQTAARYGVGGKSHVDYAGRMDIIRRVNGDKYADRILKANAAADAKAVAKGLQPADRNAREYGVLKLLAELYGGFDKIPQDDPDYVRYLDADVMAQDGLFRAQHAAVQREDLTSQRYLRREHAVTAALGASVTLEGARVDVDLTMRRWSEGQARLEASKQMMHERFGMPLEGKKPHTTNPGKAAFRAALLATGIPDAWLARNWKHNKDGSLSTAKDVMTEKLSLFEANPRGGDAAEICRTILAMNGERTIYGTMLAHLVGDRVHPYIGPDQSTGRWSMKDPGVTVFGKRGGKARERAVIVADEGEVLVAIDADQVDARVVAAECQDPEYMKLFAPGMDLHSEVAFRVWPRADQHGQDCHQEAKPGCDCGIVRKCHCDKRDKAKVFGHGFSYGLGANGMARQHGVDVAVAEGFIRGMTEAFPRLAAWKAEVRAAAGALGYDEEAPANDSYRILHTWAGRPVRVERNRAYTQATASIGQGGTRDVMAEAILNLPAARRRKIRAVIHDELVLSLPKEGAQEEAQRIADSMAFDLRGVRITFGCSRVSESWAGCYGAEYEEAA